MLFSRSHGQCTSGSLVPVLSLEGTADHTLYTYMRWQELGDMTHDVSGAHCDGHDLARWRRRKAAGCKIGITWAKHGFAWMAHR